MIIPLVPIETVSIWDQEITRLLDALLTVNAAPINSLHMIKPYSRSELYSFRDGSLEYSGQTACAGVNANRSLKLFLGGYGRLNGPASLIILSAAKVWLS